MNTLNHCGTKIQLLSSQISTLLFCAIESSSTEEIQALIEMAIEKNEVIRSELSCTQTKPEATKYNFTPLNSFTARLRLAIAHSGMTQAALASGVGVSQSTISALVTGKSKEAGIFRARAIAEALEVNAQWLLYGEGEMQPAKFLTHTNEV